MVWEMWRGDHSRGVAGGTYRFPGDELELPRPGLISAAVAVR